MSSDFNELLGKIEKHRALAERFRLDEPSVWGVQLRLFSEKISDFVALGYNVTAEQYKDRDEFLKELRRIEAIDQVQYKNLDKIRWVANQLVHGKEEYLSQSDIAQAWSSFDHLSQSQFWLKGAIQADAEVDVDAMLEALNELFDGSVKAAKTAGRIAAKGAGVAAAGLLLYGLIEHTNSPEFKAQQERERKIEKAIFLGFFAIIGVAAIVAVLIEVNK